MTQITEELAQELARELDDIRVELYKLNPELETRLALWMVAAGFRDESDMRWLPDTTQELEADAPKI